MLDIKALMFYLQFLFLRLQSFKILSWIMHEVTHVEFPHQIVNNVS